jgi:uncharacterized protein DUF6101
MQSERTTADAERQTARAPRPGVAGTRRLEAPDARADGRRRVIVLGRDGVVIARSIGGAFMTIGLRPDAFQGVVLRMRGLTEGGFQYQIELRHRDPDLCVTLCEADDDREIEAEWRLWAKFLGVPTLVEREAGRADPDRPRLGAVAIAPIGPRRRGRTITARRPRFLTRRKTGAPAKAPPSRGREIFPGAKADR